MVSTKKQVYNGKQDVTWIRVAFSLCIAFFFMLLLLASTALAEETHLYLNGQKYQGQDNRQYELLNAYSVSSFCYGKQSIGSFSVSGSAEYQDNHNGYSSYAATGPLVFGYSYDGSYKTSVKEDWNIVSDDGKTVAGIGLKSKIQDGVMLIQRSSDGLTWENAVDPIVDFFSAKKLDRSHLYSVGEEELKTGIYYRVVLAYKMGRKTGTEPRITLPVVGTVYSDEIYEYQNCIEVYQFYVYYGRNPIVLRDLISGAELSSGAVVTSGFIVNKMGSSDRVLVQKDNTPAYEVRSLETVSAAGNYTVRVVDQLGKEYVFTLKVSEGLRTLALSPTVFENEKKNEYSEVNPVTGNTAFGLPSHSVLTIGHNSGNAIVQSSRNGIPAYGISGDKVCFFLRFRDPGSLSHTGWEVVADSWGKKTSQMMNGIYVGQIDTGALVVQKSYDGTTWENADMDRYAQGLYTTDFENHYGGHGDVAVYWPKGEDLLRGVYLRVYYAYEAKQTSSKSDNRYLEKYEFYLCSDELDAVTFHNLSVTDQLKEICTDYDDATAEVYKNAETLLSGAYTVSGFSIDTSLNPTVTYTVTRDGQSIAVPSDHRFTTTGKYVISLKSAVGSSKTVIIYVDRMSTDEVLKYYFGDAFIVGKRIFTEGAYPTFEGGLSSYFLHSIDSNHLPLSGTIKNTTTGETLAISDSYSAKTDVLRTPGIYEAVFSTRPSGQLSGDSRVFTFHFAIISEGTAPGPVVNKQNLYHPTKNTVTNSYPIYYALTYQSAATGYITLAFGSREAAFEYAYNYEGGMVEPQSDGTFRYNGSFDVAQKVVYDSAWNLTDARRYFAEQAIQIGFFDLSNDFRVLSLDDKTIADNKNLRVLELARSVTVFGPDQKPLLTDLDCLPFLNSSPYLYLSVGVEGHIVSGNYPVKFVHDKYGCDSDSITIIDKNGHEYPIEYDKSVEAQLTAQGCPTGVVTIRESTVYGDTTSYEAVFLANGENTTEITISTYRDSVHEEKTFTQSSDGASIQAEAFSITSISDSLDPYSLVVVSHDLKEYPLAADKLEKGVWADPGEYRIKVVNRLGFSYAFTINIAESEYTTIRFSGEGTESAQDILTEIGQQNIKLPALYRYGYELIGFVDDAGILYESEIPSITEKGTINLTAVWKAKQYTITLQGADGMTLSTLSSAFGKECILPIPELGEDQIFTGWSLDGVILDSNLFTISAEGDVVLSAIVTANDTHPSQSNQDTSHLEMVDGVNTSSQSSVIWWIIGAAILAVGCLAVVKYVPHKKSTEEDQPHDDEEESDDP